MHKDAYTEKLNDIINLPQFDKVVPKRKNEKHPVLKEEDRVLSLLKKLRKDNKITESLFAKLKPCGSQAPRLYGLAKIHKENVPLRPVLSMPGSAYYKIANQVTEWLKVVDECNINSSTKSISDKLKDIQLEEDEEIISFDVKSLYTNVPVKEAIHDCTELLFSGRYQKPPVDKGTFKQLLDICSCDVIMLTHDGYYRQVDGLAMGSPPAPLVANGWMSKFDSKIKDNAMLYSRYMDDIIRNIKRIEIKRKLAEINKYHSSLEFTIETEQNQSIPFLDMKITRQNGKLYSTWFYKTTDTGLTMNFHAIAPLRYKKSVVSGLVHRIHRACSTWANFDTSLSKAKKLLEKNQYPPDFYEPIIYSTLEKIVTNYEHTVSEEKPEDDKNEEKLVFVQYRGKVTEKFEHSLRKIKAPCKMIKTIKKLKTVLPSLKTPIEKALKSKVVYQINCSRCEACYVGQTSRHLATRIKEHQKSGPVGSHMKSCNTSLTMDNVSIKTVSTRSIAHLMTLEALIIKSVKPDLNTKDEYRSRTLTIKL